MLNVLALPKEKSVLYSALRVGAFVAITAISAKISLPLEPVPFTLQPLAVLLSGLVLGSKEGFLSQLAYVMLIAFGLPIDARGVGSMALFSPTGGYLVGFVVASGVVGMLSERLQKTFFWRLMAGLAGVAVIYVFGGVHLLAYTGMSAERAWTVGVQPFLALDAFKAFLAVGLTESLRLFQKRS